jgi:hypothetical protein
MSVFAGTSRHRIKSRPGDYEEQLEQFEEPQCEQEEPVPDEDDLNL